MLKLHLAAPALLGFALSGAIAPAGASVVEVIIAGTVTGGSDYSGLFGDAHHFFSGGEGFVARFRFDTRIGVFESGATYSALRGGSLFGRFNPSLGATLTINGHSKAIGGAFDDTFYTSSDLLSGGQAGYATRESFGGTPFGDLAYDNSMRFEMTGPEGIFPVLLTTDFTVTVRDIPGVFGGVFDFATWDPINNLALESAMGGLSVASVTSFVVAAPEPASLALVGVGLAGIAFARRRQGRSAEAGGCRSGMIIQVDNCSRGT